MAAGDAGQREVDKLQIVHHDALDQQGDEHVDHGEEQDVCKAVFVGLGVPVGVDLSDGELGQEHQTVVQLPEQAQGLIAEQLGGKERVRALAL
jgi:hypothetical protein